MYWVIVDAAAILYVQGVLYTCTIQNLSGVISEIETQEIEHSFDNQFFLV